MGLMQHDAVVATTWKEECFYRVLRVVNSWGYPYRFLDSAASVQNGYRTILLTPDGSKEGWTESDRGDSLRTRFINLLHEDNYEDGTSPWSWVEVSWGELGSKVKRGNNLKEM
jgi:hypothetical protein